MTHLLKKCSISKVKAIFSPITLLFYSIGILFFFFPVSSKSLFIWIFKYLSNICQFPSKQQFFFDRFSTIFPFRVVFVPKCEVWKRVKKIFERVERTLSFLNFRKKVRDARADPDQEYQAEMRKKKTEKTSIFVRKTVKCHFLTKNNPRKFVDFQWNGSFF